MIWWVILVLAGIHVVAILMNLRVLLLYEHPDDSKYNQGLLAKVMALIGMQFPIFLMSGVPTDAFNAQQDGGLDMLFYWNLGFLFLTIFLSFPLPFAVFFYESDTGGSGARTPAWKKALCYTSMVFVVIAVGVGVTYAVFGKTSIPVTTLDCADEFLVKPGDTAPATVCKGGTSGSLDLKLNFMVYLAALNSFIGWLFFFLYAGVGLAALPVDLICAFIDRARPVDQKVYNERKKVLGEQASNLKAIGIVLKQREIVLRSETGLKGRRLRAGLKSDFNRYRQSVFILEKDYKKLNMSMKERGENPCVSYTKLSLGILSAVLSLVWMLHLLMYCLLPQIIGFVFTGFLNDLFELISKSGVYVIDLLLFFLLLSYLLICVIKGAFKFGMRLFCCFPIHAMRPSATHLNSFLFNVALICLASSALVQFSQHAFREYLRFSALDMIFGVQISNMTFYGVFYKYNIFNWLLFAWFLVCLIYLSLRPRDKIAISMDYAEKHKVILQGMPGPDNEKTPLAENDPENPPASGSPTASATPGRAGEVLPGSPNTLNNPTSPATGGPQQSSPTALQGGADGAKKKKGWFK